MSNQHFKLHHPHIKAEIHYLKSKYSVRTAPFHSGYKAQFFYKSTNWESAQEFIDKDICYPGERINVLIQFATAHNILKLTTGEKFQIREGAEVVGEGIVTEVVDPDVALSTVRKNLYSQIDELLWKEWDPIGVNEYPEARNEYQSYIPRIFSLKIKGASVQEIASHLLKIERDHMGLFTKEKSSKNIAQKIYDLPA